jgi:hypothetical protein
VGTVLGLVGAVIVLLIVGVVLVKTVRAANGTATPRRREFNRVVRERHDAVLAIHEVQKIINRWRPSVTDDVGLALLDDVQVRLTSYHDQAVGEKK